MQSGAVRDIPAIMANPFRSKKLRSAFKRVTIAGLIWAIGKTLRVERVNWHVLEDLRDRGRPYVMGVWHNNILFFIKLLGPERYPTLISRSRDGDDINWVAERFGIVGVRGSPSAGATGALRESLRLLAQGSPVIFTPDGPRGPRYEVKPGLVAVARKKGVPIVPICWSTDRRWEFRSWDRMKLPKPFARVVVLVGEPVMPGQDGADEEADRLRVEHAMRALVRRAERYTGADARYPDPLLAPDAPEDPARSATA